VTLNGDKAIAETNAIVVGDNAVLAVGCEGHARFYANIATMTGRKSRPLSVRIYSQRGGPIAVAAALEQTGIDQGAQTPGQDVGRDAQALLEFVKAREPVQGVANNQDAPHSPTRSRLRAMGQDILPKLFRCI
jgi:hypothetical protein